jgi:phage terminase large subunit-like protein
LDKHVLNAQAKEVRGGYWLTRRSEREKIDAAVATVLAYEARCDAIQNDDRPSGYAFL